MLSECSHVCAVLNCIAGCWRLQWLLSSKKKKENLEVNRKWCKSLVLKRKTNHQHSIHLLLFLYLSRIMTFPASDKVKALLKRPVNGRFGP